MSPQPPGCCGDLRCQGCAWDCDRPDGHVYEWDSTLELSVCKHCDNESPNLAAAVTRKPGRPS
jgi:hypothetical protein